MLNNFYIYVYLEPRESGRYCYKNFSFLYKPFYVGTRKNGRYKNINGISNAFIDMINNIKKTELEPIVIKLFENLNEKESLKKEIELIDEIGRIDLETGPLINKTIGGDGVSGYKHKEEELEKRRKNFYDIKKEFEKRSYILLTEEEDYKNAHDTKLKYTCPKGHEGYIIWNSFQQGQGCSICDDEKRRKIFSDIKQEFERRGYILLSEEKEYKDYCTKLKYTCPKGHEDSMSWNHFQQGRNCPICGDEKLRTNFLKIKNEFERRGYKLLSEEKDYKNAIITKLKYTCPTGHEGLINWSHFKQGRGCPCKKFIKLGETT